MIYQGSKAKLRQYIVPVLQDCIDRHGVTEYFANGIKDMTLLDLLEMLCDWKASSERHADGNIYRSIEINQSRFGYSDEVKDILKNTVNFLNSSKSQL